MMSRLQHLTSFSTKPNRRSYYVAGGFFTKPFLKNPDSTTSCWRKLWHLRQSKTCGIIWDVPIKNIFSPRNNNKQIMIFWRSTRLLKNVFVYLLCVILLSVWNVHVVSLSLCNVHPPITDHGLRIAHCTSTLTWIFVSLPDHCLFFGAFDTHKKVPWRGVL